MQLFKDYFGAFIPVLDSTVVVFKFRMLLSQQRTNKTFIICISELFFSFLYIFIAYAKVLKDTLSLVISEKNPVCVKLIFVCHRCLFSGSFVSKAPKDLYPKIK